MGCGCGSKGLAARTSYVVVMPSGSMKAYSSEAAAKQKVALTPGAYLKSDAPVSS